MDNWLEPLRYQYHPNPFPGSFYLSSCRPLAGPMHLSLSKPPFCIVPATFMHCWKPQTSKWETGEEFTMNLRFLISLLLVYRGRLQMIFRHLVCLQFISSYRHRQINLPKTSLWSCHLIFKNPHDYPLLIN